MRLSFALILICFSVYSFGQTGKVKFDISITDTIKPYFLDIYAHKGKILVSQITVIASGNYFLNDLEEGNYNFEIYSFQSSARRLYIDSVNVTKDSTTNLKLIYPGPCKFVYGKDYKPVCPFNHSDNIVKIQYGFPSKKAMAKAKKGMIYLGGCIISNCDPMYYCTIHKKEI